MRSLGIIGSYAAAAMIAAMDKPDALDLMGDIHIVSTAPIRPTKAFRLRIGESYPFSSRRQQERNARQFEAGQIRFTA